MAEALMEVRDLRVHFPVPRGMWGRERAMLRAVDGVSLAVAPGETVGLVGESGCGKTTTGRVLLGLQQPTGGTALYRGRDIRTLGRGGRREMRREVQAVFQDPYESLDPRMTVGQCVAEPLAVQSLHRGDARRGRVAELLGMVGLDASHAGRYPSELSGGQRQRVGIARALAVDPSFVVCDEPVASLDVSVQAQVANLLRRLQQQLGLAYLLIAHDLSVVRYLADRIVVMYAGTVVEEGPSDEVTAGPLHPYTRGLLEAVPVPEVVEGRRQADVAPLRGEVPSPVRPPRGCRFHPRCPFARERCAVEPPPLRPAAPVHTVACHFWREIEEVGT